MNIIMPTIPSVSLKNSGRLQQPQMQMNNYGGYSFSKQSPGLGSTLSGNTALNNSAISIINAYASSGTQNNATKKNKTTNVNSSAQFTEGGRNPVSQGLSNSSFFISKPDFSHTNSKVTIQFFYYTASNSKNSFNNDITAGEHNFVFRKDFSELSTTLAQLYQKEVNVIATRLYYPYLNSDIFSQYLAYNAPSNTFMDFQEAILTNPSLHKTNLPAHISGIKVQVSGRLVTETVIPRITVKSCLIGSFQRNANNITPANKISSGGAPFCLTTASIDYSKFTTKNELGAFTVKVWICQRS